MALRATYTRLGYFRIPSRNFPFDLGPRPPRAAFLPLSFAFAVWQAVVIPFAGLTWSVECQLPWRFAGPGCPRLEAKRGSYAISRWSSLSLQAAFGVAIRPRDGYKPGIVCMLAAAIVRQIAASVVGESILDIIAVGCEVLDNFNKVYPIVDEITGVITNVVALQL